MGLSTGDGLAATIRACRCGAVRIAGHPRPRRPGVGSVIDPARRAPPVRTSVVRSLPSSVTAGSIGSDVHFAATRSGRAGRPRRFPSRSSRQAPSGRCRRSSTRSMMEPLFGSSSSSRSARRHPRHLGGGSRMPWVGLSRTPSRQPRRRRLRSTRASRAGVCGGTPRSECGLGPVGARSTVPPAGFQA